MSILEDRDYGTVFEYLAAMPFDAKTNISQAVSTTTVASCWRKWGDPQ